MIARRGLRAYLLGLAGAAFVAILLFSPGSPLSLRPKKLEGTYRKAVDLDKTRYNEGKWFFEAELPDEWYPKPKYNVARLKENAPHNYKGPGYPTFATYLSSREGTLQDPYFLATQQMVYRMLWDPRSRSQHPFTVFVAPFIPQEQRDVLSAAGATVRELPLVPFEPPVTGSLIAGRLRYMFSKLSMWDQTEFSRIAYLDSDAFPIINVDGIFDVTPPQKCQRHLLPKEDKSSDTICDYALYAAMEFEDSMNAGVLILKPDHDMFERLIRESRNTSNFDPGMMEQAFLSYAFSQKGPFPAGTLEPSWNAFPHYPDAGIDVYILHAKLWAMFWEETWCSHFFNDTWKDMLQLYDSPQFEDLRAQDGQNLLAGTVQSWS